MRADMIAVLLIHMDLISAKINIQLNPEYPIAKQSVMLSVTGITGNIWFFTWFKGPEATSQYQILSYVDGSSIRGAQYFPRISAFSNGSLMITNLHVEDKGDYRVKVQTAMQEDAEIFLQIYDTVSKPVITASHSEIKENDLVSLTCASANADGITWIKSSSETISEENAITVNHDNGTIIFSEIKHTDEGKYTCWADNLVSRSSSEVFTLTISRKEDEPVIWQQYGFTSASPYITAVSKHANFNEPAPYKSAGFTAGIISGSILGLILIITVGFLLYKRYGLHGRKQMMEPPIDGLLDPYAIYNNILEPPTGLETKDEPLYMGPEPNDEPLYMCLQSSSEGTYNELHK
ncbi:uncharacterized protein LOC121002779 [Bufo bufo]|uniref:uncharacterized protein LOC121002779 n=1 Tax=Bufo bufo TaxID=8384 RepID=UPI001ABEE053|nr:uncharacterized protein LOC121002779 [Bufo bufo]